jgi:hypothetical protein
MAVQVMRKQWRAAWTMLREEHRLERLARESMLSRTSDGRLMRQDLPERPCVACGETFKPFMQRSLYCSIKCGNSMKNHQHLYNDIEDNDERRLFAAIAGKVHRVYVDIDKANKQAAKKEIVHG